MSSAYVPQAGELGQTEEEKKAAERAKMPYWQQNYLAGTDAGKSEFYDDPDMQDLRTRRQNLAEGYSGGELGALRGGARNEVAGQRQGYMNQLRANLGRGGVGGARGAAMLGAADQKFAATGADNERKMLLDSAKMKREGVNDLQDFLFRQKFGKLATGSGYAQLALAEKAANDMRTAANAKGYDPMNELKDQYQDKTVSGRLLEWLGV